MDDFGGKAFRKGDPIPAAWANWVNRNIGRNRVSGGAGLEVRQGLGGPQIALVFELLAFARTGSSIPAKASGVPGSGTVTLYLWDGTEETLSSDTLPVRNRWTKVVPGSTDVLLGKPHGSDDWFVLGWDC
jgi:hypothetical protein